MKNKDKVEIKNLRDTTNQEYYITKDIVIPKGSRLENWSLQQKNDNNRFERNKEILN